MSQTEKIKVLNDCVDAWIEQWHENQEMLESLRAQLRDAQRRLSLIQQVVR